jgi:hypothetical protein
VPLLLGGDFRRRVDVARLRVVVFVPDVDLRLVVVFFADAALGRDVDAAEDLRRDAGLRLVVVFFADAAFGRDVDAAEDLRRDAGLRLVVVFFADADFGRDADAAEDLRRDAVLRLVVDLRFDDEPPVTRFVNPARAVAAFSICATPFATSSWASVTALSTGFRALDRFDLVVFRAAIAFSCQMP